jgi:hypothetical protein
MPQVPGTVRGCGAAYQSGGHTEAEADLAYASRTGGANPDSPARFSGSLPEGEPQTLPGVSAGVAATPPPSPSANVPLLLCVDPEGAYIQMLLEETAV